MQHFLRPLILPRSVALVGASERAGSVGRTAFANLLAGGFTGPIHAVTPRYPAVLGRPAFATLRDVPAPVDLAVIAAPAHAVMGVLADAAAIGTRVAVLMTAPPAKGAGEWNAGVRDTAARAGIRLVGAGAFGVIRTDIGLNATFCAPVARPGRLALVSQSGAVATALLDFAGPQNVGFSTVLSLGTGLDVGFGELLDALVGDPLTEGILLYVEDVVHARPFVSALRSAARTKPVIVLRAGHSLEPRRTPPTDRVFDAALARAGAVRVQNYTELFAAARILAGGRVPRSDHVAIVANGRGPALLAADQVARRGLTLARLAPATERALAQLLPEGSESRNPVDVRGDAPASSFAEAIALLAADPAVDAVVALHVARPAMGAGDAAQHAADVALRSRKPVLGAWLGALDRPDVQAALDRGGIVNFYTPENAIDAFSLLAAYRRNQRLLLEVPPPQPEPQALDLAAAEQLRVRLAEAGHTTLTREEAAALLAAFGVVCAAHAVAWTLAEAEAALRTLRFPVTLTALHGDAPWTRTVRNRAALVAAWDDMTAHHHEAGIERPRVEMEKPHRAAVVPLALGVATDPVFGPVVTIAAMPGDDAPARTAVALPPLNRALADDLLADARVRTGVRLGDPAAQVAMEAALARLLVRVSAMIGALPWLTGLALSRLTLEGEDVVVGVARAHVDATRARTSGYAHMAIHPYPVELIDRVTLSDDRVVTVRPIRPEDGELERAFVEGLSQESRYFRFFYQLSGLSPAMIARFTQVDYDREMALVAVVDATTDDDTQAIVGVARYMANPDGESAEFAVVVADAWQKRGLAFALMSRLVAAARRRGFARLDGAVLRSNVAMLAFVARLGFTVRDDPGAPEQVAVSLALAPDAH